MKAVIRVVSLSLAALSVAASCLFAQSDPMAKWMPNVGDEFVYFVTDTSITYWHDVPYSILPGTDTITLRIAGIDSIIDSTHHFVVTAISGSTRDSLPTIGQYDFHPGRTLSSAHPFAIDLGPSFSRKFDFSESAQVRVTVGVDTLDAYSTTFDTASNELPGSYDHEVMAYSPLLHWFYSMNSSRALDIPPDKNYDGVSSTLRLISSNIFRSSVGRSPSHYLPTSSLQQSGPLLMVSRVSNRVDHYSISLLDPLGRPIRSWYMPAEAGERLITLNIADVPSGVYFLRMRVGEADEVNRICFVR